MTKLTINETFLNAKNTYMYHFKIIFMLSVILNFISEYFILYVKNSGFMQAVKEYEKTNLFPQNFSGESSLLWMGLAVIIVSMVIYALTMFILSIKLDGENKDSKKQSIFIALRAIKGKLLKLTGVYIVTGIAWVILVSFLNVLGLYITILFMMFAVPGVLISKKGVFQSIYDNFNFVKSNLLYNAVIAFSVIALLTIKTIISAILIKSNLSQNSFAIAHVLSVIFDSLITPFMLAIIVSAYLKNIEHAEISAQ